MDKIGVGIITCNRPEYLKQLLNSIIPCKFDELVIVNDGDSLSTLDFPSPYTYIKNETNLGVCKTKNVAFKHLLKEQCDHIFIIEDDITIKNPDVFNAYIKLAKRSKLQHLMYGYHGPANKGGVSKGQPQPKLIIDYDDIKLALNPNCVGAFCYYTRKCLEDVGLFDEDFYQAFDHVEHTYRLSKAGYCTPYWWWPDLANSYDYLDEIECSENSSAIRFTPKWQENIQNAAAKFKQKHGYLPAWQGCVPDTKVEDIILFLKQLQ